MEELIIYEVEDKFILLKPVYHKAYKSIITSFEEYKTKLRIIQRIEINNEICDYLTFDEIEEIEPVDETKKAKDFITEKQFEEYNKQSKVDIYNLFGKIRDTKLIDEDKTKTK